MIHLEHTYADLPSAFHERVAPSSAVDPVMLAFNAPLAEALGLDLADASDAQRAAWLSGKVLPEGARPVAMAYAGHQFGHFVPQLGDGRAILLGEVVAPDGARYDVHLKGAGRTRFSRGGDGRASLGPVLREYVVSEAMHALGIPTTRALAAIATGERVYRSAALPGAMVVRVASSHLRVGTFEYFAARRQHDHLRRLLDYAIHRHDPELASLPLDERALAFLERVARRKLDLVARWMGVGFIHGVMNTDNTSIAGESIDFGPCAFMDTFDPDQVFSSIDHAGRYRYSNQGAIAVWNLSVLASCLVPFVDDDEEAAVAKLNAALDTFDDLFVEAWTRVMGAKLGIFAPVADDRPLIQAWFDHMEAERLDFTNAFRALPSQLDADTPLHARLRERLDQQPQPRAEAAALMRRSNPAYIPRNHLIEQAIDDAIDGDLSAFHALHDALADPYTERDALAAFAEPPRPEEVVHQTFCGT